MHSHLRTAFHFYAASYNLPSAYSVRPVNSCLPVSLFVVFVELLPGVGGVLHLLGLASHVGHEAIMLALVEHMHDQREKDPDERNQ